MGHILDSPACFGMFRITADCRARLAVSKTVREQFPMGERESSTQHEQTT